MPRKLNDLTGQRFGRLVVVKRHETSSRPVMWECQCDCGNKSIVAYKHLAYGETVSCGCYREELNKRPRTHGQSCKVTKGLTSTYVVWEGMKQRCHNPNYHDYKSYGGRGITVSEEWRNSFETFFADMGKKPKGKTLERIENDEGYSKGNCKWATKKDQACNRRNTRMITFNGKTQTMTDWAREYGLPRGVLWQRLYNMKWSIKDALERPARKLMRG